MNKYNVVKTIAKRTTLTSKQVREVLECFIDVIEESLVSGEKVYIDGLGAFEIKERASRVGRNLYANELISIPACMVPSFKPSKRLKDKVYKNIESEG